jgi:hypothetical protein
MEKVSDLLELTTTFVENIFSMLENLKNNLGTYRVDNLNDVRASIKKIMNGTYNIEYCDICSVEENLVDEETAHILFKFVHYTVSSMTTEPYWLITLTTSNTSSTDSCMANYLAKIAFVDKTYAPPKIIVKMIDIVDNSGTEDITENTDEIAEVLNDPETWTDDISFIDNVGKIYNIDDLLNKTVLTGDHVIFVVE